MKIPEPEWKGAVAFAEFAEALSLPTDHIISAMRPAGTTGFVVLYTPHIPDGDYDPASLAVFSVVLVRDGDGVLRPAAPARRARSPFA